MKKLGKKLNMLQETIEAYACRCNSCNCGCACYCSGIFAAGSMIQTDVSAGAQALNEDNTNDAQNNTYVK